MEDHGNLHICPVFHKHLCAGGSYHAADPGVLLHCGLHGFARFDFPGNQFLFMVLIATLMLPNAIIIIPRYALFNKLGWLTPI